MLKNIKLLREERGISQQKLGDEIGMSQQSVNGYENHNIEPDIATLIKLACFFETSVDFIIGNTNIRHKIEETSEYSLNQAEIDHINNYRKLPKATRKLVDDLIIDRLGI